MFQRIFSFVIPPYCRARARRNGSTIGVLERVINARPDIVYSQTNGMVRHDSSACRRGRWMCRREA